MIRNSKTGLNGIALSAILVLSTACPSLNALAQEEQVIRDPDRTITPVVFEGEVTPYNVYKTADELTDVVDTGKELEYTPVEATEYEAFGWGYEDEAKAWEAVRREAPSHPNGVRKHPGKYFENFGYIEGTHKSSYNTDLPRWGAYLWVLQNTVRFTAYDKLIWYSPGGHVPNTVQKVIVCSLGEYDPMTEYEEDWPGFPQIPERDSKVGIYDDLDPGERKSVKFTVEPQVYLRLGPAGDLEGYHAYRTDESEAVDEELETDPGVVICGYDGEEGAREAKLVVRGIPTLANSSRYERYLKITNRQKIMMAEAGSEPVAVGDSYPLEGSITEDKTFTVTASGTWGGDDYAAIELVIQDTVTEEEGASDRVKFIMLETDLDADINGDTYFNEDDPEETEGLGLVVSVNDDDDGDPEGVDCGNEVIDTPDDRDDMKKLKLRRLKPYFLMSGTVRLTVDNTGKIRIFDQDGNVCMAPEDTVAEVLLSEITAGELEYLVEGVDGGQVALTLEYVDDHGNVLDSDMVQITVLDLDLFRDEECTEVLDDWPEKEVEGQLRSPKYYFGIYDPVVVRLRGPSGQGDECFTVRVKSESSEAGIHLCMKETSTPGTYMQKFYLGRSTHAYTEDDDYLLKIVEEEVVDMSVKASGNEVGVKVDVMVDKGEYASGTGNDTYAPARNVDRLHVSNRLYANMCDSEDGLRWSSCGKLDAEDISQLIINAGRQIAGCEQSDILFVQTHGRYFSRPGEPLTPSWASGDLIIVGNQQLPQSERVHLCPESIAFGQWSSDVEWVVLRACGALCDYTDLTVWGGAVGVPYDKTARDRWLATIMPRVSPGRTPHGILGYTETCKSAFLDGIDAFYAKLAEGYCIPEAWIYANTHGEFKDYHQPYAVLCHTRNWSDRLRCGVISPDVTDTDYSFAWCHRADGGIGEGQEQFSPTEGASHASPMRRSIHPEAKPTPRQPIPVKHVGLCRRGTVSAKGYQRFHLGSNVCYLSRMNMPELGNARETECRRKTELFLQDNADGVPRDASLSYVCPFYYSETGKDTVVAGYLVAYLHKINGIEVDGDVIKFTVTEKGVAGYSERWHEISETEGRSQLAVNPTLSPDEYVAPAITPEDALDIVRSARNINASAGDVLDEVRSLKQVLRLNKSETQLRAAYKMTLESGDMAFVDCETGDLEVVGCRGE